MNALMFLYKRVLKQPLEGSIDAVHADKKINVPVVMTREEVAAVLSLMSGTAQLVAKLFYGSGLCIMETVRLRVKDIGWEMKLPRQALYAFHFSLSVCEARVRPCPECFFRSRRCFLKRKG